MAYTSEFPFVYVTADVVAFSVRPDSGLSVLLVRRQHPPHQGRWALPGGFVDEDEDLEPAARRELREETGLSLRGVPLEQLRAYGAPRRDPRHRIVSVAFVAVLGPDTRPRAGDDAAEAAWRPVRDLLGSRRLAFDHARILADAVDLVARRLEDTALALRFLPAEFTVSELREVYEAVWGRQLDPGNFQRKVTGADGFVEETGRRTSGGRGRPAALYRAGERATIWPPLSRDRDH